MKDEYIWYCPDCGGIVTEEQNGDVWCEFVETCGWSMSEKELHSNVDITDKRKPSNLKIAC